MRSLRIPQELNPLTSLLPLVFEKIPTSRFKQKTGTPTLRRLKKHRLQCKDCRKVTVAETLIVEKNHQISNLIRQKVRFITMDMSGAYIPLVRRLS